MIDKLTPEQEVLIPIVREEWENCFYKLPRFDEGVIQDVIPKIYGKPTKIWFYNGSPFGLQILVNVLQNIWQDIEQNIEQDIWQNIWQNIGQNIEQNIEQNIWQNIGQNIEQDIWQNIGQNIEQNIWQNIRQNLRQNIEQDIWQNIGQNIGQNIWQNIGQNIEQNIGQNIWQNIWQNIEQNIGQNIWQNIWQNIEQNIRQNIKYNIFGWYIRCDDLGWVAFYDYFQRANLLKYNSPLFEDYKRLVGSGVFSSIQFENICFVCALPISVKVDDRKRLHSINSPAIEWKDGWGLYFIHGVTVPEYVVMNPEKITVQDIEKEENAEIRRVKINRYGQDKFLKDSGSIKVHEDDYGTLWKKDLLNDEPIIMVELINSTPEPDNSFKHYFIRVPPTVKTAHEAVGWTFGKTDKNYSPLIMS